MTAEEFLKGCEHDGSFIPVKEVIRLMEEYANQSKPSQEEIKKAFRGCHEESKPLPSDEDINFEIKICKCDNPQFETPDKLWCSSCRRPIGFNNESKQSKENDDFQEDVKLMRDNHQPKQIDCEHEYYDVYFVNGDNAPFELDCRKCIKCGQEDNTI